MRRGQHVGGPTPSFSQVVDAEEGGRKTASGQLARPRPTRVPACPPPRRPPPSSFARPARPPAASLLLLRRGPADGAPSRRCGAGPSRGVAQRTHMPERGCRTRRLAQRRAARHRLASELLASEVMLPMTARDFLHGVAALRRARERASSTKHQDDGSSEDCSQGGGRQAASTRSSADLPGLERTWPALLRPVCPRSAPSSWARRWQNHRRTSIVFCLLLLWTGPSTPRAALLNAHAVAKDVLGPARVKPAVRDRSTLEAVRHAERAGADRLCGRSTAGHVLSRPRQIEQPFFSQHVLAIPPRGEDNSIPPSASMRGVRRAGQPSTEAPRGLSSPLRAAGSRLFLRALAAALWSCPLVRPCGPAALRG